MHDLSVVIVSWNVRGFLKACLSSIYRFTAEVDVEVFVVDNHSTDGSAEMVRKEFPRVRLIENADNVGFSRANNQALKECAGRYALLLNPDTELLDNAFKKMVAFMDSHADADGFAPRLVYDDGRLQPNCRSFPSLFTDLMETLYLDMLFPDSPVCNRYRMGGWGHTGTREIDQPYGACLLIRRTALDRVGLMDEGLFMYYDEVDLCYRIKKSGGRIFFSDTITVVHHANQSSNQTRVDCEHYKHASRLRYFAKHYGIWSIYALTLDLALRTALVWCVFGLTHLLFRRPRDLEFFKAPVRIMWSETGRFFARKVNA